MKLSVSSFRAPEWKPLALASAISTFFVPFALAQTDEVKTLAPVVVTASRFPNDPSMMPIGASVITADEIRSAGVNNVNEAVRKIGGVQGRQSSYGTQDFDLDLRGFGAAGNQNMVVLVDGIRLSENEQAVAMLSSIPIDMVERIEIIRGGSSVLYGDGATGGVIHIITKRGIVQGTHGSIVAEVGQFNHRELRASVMKGVDGFSLDANASRMQSDNYRDNNAARQENFSGGMQWSSREGRAGLRVDIARQDSRLPGPLALDAFYANPRQTATPDAYASIDTNRYTAYIERSLGAWELATEISHREKTVNAMFEYAGGYTESAYSSMKQTQISPRLRHLSTNNGITNEFVTGLDFAHWTRDTERGGYSHVVATQNSEAIYARNEIKWEKIRVAFGARHEIFDKDSTGDEIYNRKQSLNAWELQGSYAVTSLLSLFAKGGQSYRVANADDNAYLGGVILKPQTSHDWEVGISLGDRAHKLTAKLFQHRLHNEIAFNPFSFINYNLDPTRRQGMELEVATRLATSWSLSAQWQHMNAEFTDGPNAGREIPLVPKNKLTARLNWLPADGQTASVGMTWVSVQRYDNDFDNSCTTKIPSYATLDARYAKRTGPWEFAIVGENLTNRQYYSYALKSTDNLRFNVYPNAGRQLKISVRYDF